MKLPRFAALPLLLTALAASAQNPAAQRYAWKNVQIVGGGFVDGIVFHPTAADVRYARTDIGGAYRWDNAAHRWQSMLDWISWKDRNLMGIESIAIDPSDPDRVYLACGTYTNAETPMGAILRSSDRGRTFQHTNVPIKFGGNEDGRGNGERLVVDPQDGRILYLGTRHDGLWRSRDRGVTWMRVASFPDVTEPASLASAPIPGETPQQHWRRMPIRGDGIVFVKFLPTASSKQRFATQTIYVGVSLMNRANLFASTDAGVTWQPVPGQPTQYRPTRAAFSSDGFLYIAYGTAPGPSRMTNGAVWKLNTQTGAWTDITPERPIPGSKEFGYAAVAVDAHHPQTVIASTFGRPWSEGGDTIFRSTDGGATWKPVFGGAHGGVYDYSLAPYVKPTPIHWLFDIEIDPANSDHAVFTTGYGGWETFDLTAVDRGQPTHWSILATGIEETVALATRLTHRRRALSSPPSVTTAASYIGISIIPHPTAHRRRRVSATPPASSPPHFTPGRSSASASAPSTNPATASATRSIPATPGNRRRLFQHRPVAPAPSLSPPMAPRGSGPLTARLLSSRTTSAPRGNQRRDSRPEPASSPIPETPRPFTRFPSRIASCFAVWTQRQLSQPRISTCKMRRPLPPLRAAILAAVRIVSTPHPAAPPICGSPPSMASITPPP